MSFGNNDCQVDCILITINVQLINMYLVYRKIVTLSMSLCAKDIKMSIHYLRVLVIIYFYAVYLRKSVTKRNRFYDETSH